MARIAVAYISKYGGAKQYAQWIAAALGADMMELTKQSASNLASYDVVIFGGGIYAGKISGIDLIRKNFAALKGRNLVLFTVGLTSPESSAYYRELLKKQLTPEMRARIMAFHFRGGIDYSRLSAPHRMIMGVLHAALRRKKPPELSEDDRALLMSFGKTVSYAEESFVEPLLGYICGLE